MKFGIPGLGQIVKGVTSTIDNLHTSEEEKLRIGLQERAIDATLQKAQIDVNKEAAKHPSLFVAGARASAIWVCVAGLAYQFTMYPFLQWIWVFTQALGWIPTEVVPPPPLDITTLLSLLGALLGIGGFRTVEKLRGKQTDRIS